MKTRNVMKAMQSTPFPWAESTISIEYRRPWEEDVEAEWTFVLTLVVE